MTKEENDILWQEYFYPKTNVLINKFNIKDNDKLKTVEVNLTTEKLLILEKATLDEDTDKNRLNKIHEYLFKDIYPFAGKYRKVNMMKEIGTFLTINKSNDIDIELDDLFKRINIMLKNCHSIDEFSDILATLYTSLIYIHP